MGSRWEGRRRWRSAGRSSACSRSRSRSAWRNWRRRSRPPMYHWACRLGGKGWGWFTAWFNIIGQIAAIAGIDYGCALFVTPLIGLKATTQNLLIVYAVILLSHALINHFGIRLVARLNDFSVTVHIVGVIVIVGALLIFAP